VKSFFRDQGKGKINPCTPKWTPILEVGVLSFQRVIWGGQNSLNWKLLYIIKNLLRRRCLKWAHTIHLSIYSTSYGQKKGQESRCHFDFQPLTVWNRLEIHAFRWRATYFGKLSTRATIFFLTPSQSEVCKKLWASKLARVSVSRFLGYLTWEFQKKLYFDADLMANHR
jgi:hypothetical protein